MTNTDLALPKNLRDVITEYDQKRASATDAVKAFEAAGDALKSACTIGGVWGDVRINTGSVYEREIQASLLKSAWKHVYDGLSIERIASAADKRKWQQSLADPAPFTLDNIRATFGDYIVNPRINILRGLAEVFCDLDPAYKSHDKVKIGVKGLPKRIILHVGDGYGWGKDRLEGVLNALAAYQGKPLTEWQEIQDLLKSADALKDSRGVHLKRYSNGNGHLHFEPDTLRDINLMTRSLASHQTLTAPGDIQIDSRESNHLTGCSAQPHQYCGFIGLGSARSRFISGLLPAAAPDT